MLEIWWVVLIVKIQEQFKNFEGLWELFVLVDEIIERLNGCVRNVLFVVDDELCNFLKLL